MRAPSQRTALGILFLVLTAIFAVIAVAALRARVWVIALASLALAVWLASLALGALRSQLRR